VQESQLCYKGGLQGRLMLGIKFFFAPSQVLPSTVVCAPLRSGALSVRGVV